MGKVKLLRKLLKDPSSLPLLSSLGKHNKLEEGDFASVKKFIQYVAIMDNTMRHT